MIDYTSGMGWQGLREPDNKSKSFSLLQAGAHKTPHKPVILEDYVDEEDLECEETGI